MHNNDDRDALRQVQREKEIQPSPLVVGLVMVVVAAIYVWWLGGG